MAEKRVGLQLPWTWPPGFAKLRPLFFQQDRLASAAMISYFTLAARSLGLAVGGSACSWCGLGLFGLQAMGAP